MVRGLQQRNTAVMGAFAVSHSIQPRMPERARWRPGTRPFLQLTLVIVDDDARKFEKGGGFICRCPVLRQLKPLQRIILTCQGQFKSGGAERTPSHFLPHKTLDLELF